MPLKNVLQWSVARMSSIEAIRLWGAHTRRYKSRGTHILYASTIWRLKDFLPTQIKDVKLEHLERFLASVEGGAANSYNAHITALQSFGAWLSQHDLPNPTAKLKRIRTTHIPARVLIEKELNKLLAICNQRERDILQFLANTGLRADEFLRLTPQNVSPDGKFLYIIGKGKKPRSVPLNNICREILTRHPTLKFSKNYKILWYMCGSIAKRAGISHFSPHSMRHFFATRLIEKGVNLYQISKCLGHSETRTTEQIYLHWCQKDAVAGITDCLDE